MRDLGREMEGTDSYGEAEKGEGHISALDHLGFDTEDDASVQEDGKGVEVDEYWEGDHV